MFSDYISLMLIVITSYSIHYTKLYDASGAELILGEVSEGTYTVEASYGGFGCITPMNGGIPLVIEAPLSSPDKKKLSIDKNNVCASVGAKLKLEASQSGVTYRLFADDIDMNMDSIRNNFVQHTLYEVIRAGSGNYTYEFFVGPVAGPWVSQGAPSATNTLNVLINTSKRVRVNILDLTTGCTNTSFQDVTMIANPVASITAPVDNSEICAGKPVTITASPSGLGTYEFYANEGSGDVLLNSSSSNSYNKATGFTNNASIYAVVVITSYSIHYTKLYETVESYLHNLKNDSCCQERIGTPGAIYHQ